MTVEVEWASNGDINEARRSLAGPALAERLRRDGEPFLFPVEDMIENERQHFVIIDHPWRPRDTHEELVTPHFGLIRDGTLRLEGYLEIEARYLKLTRLLYGASHCRSVVQVPSQLSPDGRRALQTFHEKPIVAQVKSLLNALKHKPNIINVGDLDTLELLMRLGIREIAMNTFVFPTTGTCLVNHWDMRLIAYGAQPTSIAMLHQFASDCGLLVRHL